MNKLFLILILLIIGIGSFFRFRDKGNSNTMTQRDTTQSAEVTATPQPSEVSTNPLSIAAMRQKSYPGSKLHIEQRLSPGHNYQRYVVSYQSEGLTIYGLLTVPTGQKPKGGWPVILFNHGYIPPAQYSTISSYAVMVEPLASAGYIVFKPDYRGNGNSQGDPSQIYISPDYVTDSMNALASIKQYKDANPNKIGVFGHSMGGSITLHELVISHDIKAADLASGVVGDASQLLTWWDNRVASRSISGNDLTTAKIIQQMIDTNGSPGANPAFWNAIDPTAYVSSVTAAVEIQVGSADEEVPPSFSTSLRDRLQKAGKSVTFHEYPGADHNLAPDTALAIQQAIQFFNIHLK